MGFSIYEKDNKGTSQGRNPITSTMNKNKRKVIRNTDKRKPR